MAYKGDFFASMLSSVITAAVGLLFIVFLMDGKTITEMKGWSRDEVLFIYGYAMLPTAIFSTVSRNLYRFGDRYIIQGEFDRILVRPLSSLCQVLFESFNLEVIGNFLLGMAILIHTKNRLQLSFDVFDMFWLVISSISGAVILISVFVALASLSFHFEDRLGIGAPFYNLMNLARYPLPIFNRVIQFVLCWVVPFAFVAFYPATHFFSKTGFAFYCYLSPVIAIVYLFIAGICWSYGVSKYTSTGS